MGKRLELPAEQAGVEVVSSVSWISTLPRVVQGKMKNLRVVSNHSQV